MPAKTGYGPGPINGGSATRDGRYRREPGPTREGIEMRREPGELAQHDGYYRRQLARARDDIDRRRDRGELTRREARQLKRELGRIDAAAAWYGRDGFSASELGALELRASELRNRTATGRTRQAN